MFRKHQGRRSTNIVFVLFRMILSMVMFTVLLGGIYSAYKHFSGYDPLKLDPQAIISELLAGKVPKEVLGVISSRKILFQQSNKIIPLDTIKTTDNKTDNKLEFHFLLIADTHSDSVDLDKALKQAKREFPDLKFIIGLGDYTDVGTIAELKNAKTELDSSGLRYFVVAGDHDLWDSRNKQLPPITNFNQVFGPVYQSFDYGGFYFLLLDNSDDYKGFGEEQQKWIERELEKAKNTRGLFVFLHEPLYHPSSDHVMGKTESGLKQQARDLMFQLKGANVKKVFAGDIHFFSQYNEPVTGLAMMTIGAVTIERNPQAPRFAVVSVFEDGSTRVDDLEIK